MWYQNFTLNYSLSSKTNIINILHSWSYIPLWLLFLLFLIAEAFLRKISFPENRKKSCSLILQLSGLKIQSMWVQWSKSFQKRIYSKYYISLNSDLLTKNVFYFKIDSLKFLIGLLDMNLLQEQGRSWAFNQSLLNCKLFWFEVIQ